MTTRLLCCLVCISAARLAGAPPDAESPTNVKFPPPGAKPVQHPGLHNVIHVMDGLYSGGSPEGDVGFATLKSLGIRTILTVDGAQPEVERARKFGLRYVHLPIGYDGVNEDQALRLARAVRDLPQPVYMHCHHGKHRSPGAAAAVLYCLDASCSVAQAVDVMKRAGTDPRYVGLIEAPRKIRKPSKEALDAVKVEFRESVRPAALAESMVRMDETWDRLTQAKNLGWTKPPQHPDVDPPHEALQLMEHYRELARLPQVKTRPVDFLRWTTEGESAASALEKVLRAGAGDKSKADQFWQKSRATCAACHAKYRDVPRPR